MMSSVGITLGEMVGLEGRQYMNTLTFIPELLPKASLFYSKPLEDLEENLLQTIINKSAKQ